MSILSGVTLLILFCVATSSFQKTNLKWKKSVWIDFDETISVWDTTLHFAKVISDGLKPRWETIWNEYLVEHKKAYDIQCTDGCFDRSSGGCEPTHTLKGTKTGDAILAVESGICQLNNAEKKLYNTLRCSNLFVGSTNETLFNHGHCACLHKSVGCAIQSFLQNRIHVNILSLHWSSHYIRGALVYNGVNTNLLNIDSNDLETCKGITTGQIKTSMINGIHKLKRFNQFKKMHDGVETAFIGDAIHDFPSMLAADIGIWVESTQEASKTFILKTLKKGGVAVMDLPTAASQGCPEKRDHAKPRIYKTRNWLDIQHIIQHCKLRPNET